MERFWFTIDFAGLDVAWPWSEEDPHGCFPTEPGDTVDGLLAAYRAECARSREIVAGAAFDDRARSDGMTFTLRYAVAHLIEETAFHLGHLDLLRESTDGLVGE
ncbi:hypothetical protein GCM10009742_36330 [Kribbella karoonensis]|uniref:DinB family protein n=1 Tax=Kribbella karoonensis TaxID=324851 RepID=A0ABN2DW95_9ACTN